MIEDEAAIQPAILSLALEKLAEFRKEVERDLPGIFVLGVFGAEPDDLAS
jgi:hypothetical protein